MARSAAGFSIQPQATNQIKDLREIVSPFSLAHVNQVSTELQAQGRLTSFHGWGVLMLLPVRRLD